MIFFVNLDAEKHWHKRKMYTSSNTNALQNGGYTEATVAVGKYIAFTSNSQKEEESGSWYNSMAPAVKLMIDNEKKLELELGFPTPTALENLDRQVGGETR